MCQGFSLSLSLSHTYTHQSALQFLQSSYHLSAVVLKRLLLKTHLISSLALASAAKLEQNQFFDFQIT